MKSSFFKDGIAAGTVVIMLGFMRSGKTNFSVVLMDGAAKAGYNVFCNTHFFRASQVEEAKEKGLLNPKINYKILPDNIITVTTAYELLKGLHKHQLKKRQSLVFLDEASLFAGSTMGMHTRVRWLKNLVVTIGKLNAGIMLIWQAKKSVIPMLREELVTLELLVKKQGKHRMCEIRNIREGEKRLIWNWYNLPETDLPYDTKAISEFVFDIDSDYLFEEVSKYNTLDMEDKFIPVLEKAKKIKEVKNNDNEKEKKPSQRDVVANAETFEEAIVLCKKAGIKPIKKQYWAQIQSGY
jgi:hypothetical protein